MRNLWSPTMADRPTPVPSTAARIYLSAVGIALLLAGLGFAWGLIHAWQRAEVARGWTGVPCVIVSSGVRDVAPGNQPRWQAAVEYRYNWDGREYTGTRIRRGEGPSAHRQQAAARAAKYPAGLKTSCFVDPEEPASAVLEHSTRAPLYSIWFPLLFAVGGAGMLRSAWRRRRTGRDRHDAANRDIPEGLPVSSP